MLVGAWERGVGWFELDGTLQVGSDCVGYEQLVMEGTGRCHVSWKRQARSKIREKGRVVPKARDNVLCMGACTGIVQEGRCRSGWPCRWVFAWEREGLDLGQRMRAGW